MRFLSGRNLVAALAITFVGLSFSVQAEEQISMADVLARMKAMEKKMAHQDEQISTLKGRLHTAEAIAEQRPRVDEAVDRALYKTGVSSQVFHDPDLHKRAIKIGGHVDISYQFSFNTPEKVDPESGATPVQNAFRIFDRDESNDFTANQIGLYLDGTAQEAGEAGFRFDLDFGEDTVTKAGLTGEQIFTFNNMKQGYIDYIAPFGNGVRISAGRFVTPIGYEVIESHGNWNATRSFNFGLAIPFTHTGLRFEYEVNDKWSVAALLVNGWDNTIDSNDDKTFIMQSTWKPTDWITWIVNGSIGNEGGRDGRNEGDTRYMANTNVSFSPWDKWEFALNANFGYEENQGFHKERAYLNPVVGNTTPFPFGSDDAMWWGVAGYAKWQFLPKWYVATRGEVFDDRGGTRTGLTDVNGLGQKVQLYSFTATVGWQLSGPMQLRFEYRHDGASRSAFNDGSRNPGVDGTGADVDGDGFPDPDASRGGRSTQDTLMLQWLYQF